MEPASETSLAVAADSTLDAPNKHPETDLLAFAQRTANDHKMIGLLVSKLFSTPKPRLMTPEDLWTTIKQKVEDKLRDKERKDGQTAR